MKAIPAFLLSLSIAPFGQIKQPTASNTSWKILDPGKYSIQYPETWKPDQSKEMGSSFIIFSPLISQKDNFSENVNLLIQDLRGKNINLAKYTQISEHQIKTLGTNSSIIESKRIKKGTDEYQRIIYNNDQDGFHLRFIQYYIIHNEKAYVLTFTAEQTTFDEYRQTGEQMLNSFKLKK